jgi:hypothetical protein
VICAPPRFPVGGICAGTKAAKSNNTIAVPIIRIWASFNAFVRANLVFRNVDGNWTALRAKKNRKKYPLLVQ